MFKNGIWEMNRTEKRLYENPNKKYMMNNETVLCWHAQSEEITHSSFPVIHKVGNVDIFVFA